MRWISPALSRFLFLTFLLCCSLDVNAQEKAGQPTDLGSPPKPHAEVQAILDRSDALIKRYKWTEVLKGFDEALATSRRLMDKVGEGTALRKMGTVFMITAQPQKAVQYLEQALVISRAVGDKSGEAMCVGNLGMVYQNIGQPQKALLNYEQALQVFRIVGNKLDEANALGNIGIVYLNTGQPQKAMVHYKNASTLFRALGEKSGEAAMDVNIGRVFTTIGQPQKALVHFEHGLAIFRMLGDKGDEARTLNNLGNAHLDTNRWRKALVYLEQSLSITRAVGDKRTEAAVLMNLGHFYMTSGQPQKALANYEQSQTIYRSAGDRRGDADTLYSMAALYRSIGQVPKALEYYRQVLAVYRVTGDKHGEARTLGSIGGAYLIVDQQKNALEYYQQARTMYKAIGDRAAEAGALVNIGIVFQNTGQSQKALAYHKMALPITRAIGDDLNVARTLNSIGAAYRTAGQSQAALAYHKQALPIFVAIGDKHGEAATLNYIGMNYYETGSAAKALSTWRQALDLREKYREAIGADTETKQHFLASIASEYDRYIALLHEQNRQDEAFDWTQKVKARSLLDLLKASRLDLEHDLSKEEHEHLANLRDGITRLNKEQIAEGLHSPDRATERFKSARIQLARAQNALESYRSALYRKRPDLANLESALTLRKSDLPRLLSSDTALLEYVALRTDIGKKKVDRTLLFVATVENGKPRLSVHHISISKDALKEKCQDFREACADKAQPSYRSKGQELYRLLVAPASIQLTGKKRLLICPDGALWALPFQAILARNGEHLWERYEMAYAYSATGALAAREAKRAPGWSRHIQTLLAVANPDFGDADRFEGTGGGGDRPLTMPSRALEMSSRDLFGIQRGGITPLPGTHLEAESLRTLYPDATILEGKDAQEADVKSQMGKYRYLHFATHGLFNSSAPMLSSIVLAMPRPPKPNSGGIQEDGFLTAGELYEMKLSADLVTLSACDTARGDARAGEGLIGLTWALFASGCPSAVVSQWKVDDNSTPELMGEFYVGLKHGLGKSAALRRAALGLLRDRKYAHPYFWAPFVLMGDWR